MSSPPINPTPPTVSIPLAARFAHEILKPSTWQAFERYCTLLFRAELGDPNAQVYGRFGQDQGGIDILGARGGNPNHHVGIQCRAVEKPLTKKQILAECRSAIELKAV